MPNWIGLLLVLGFVTLILGVYMLITRSAGIYATPRQFRNVLLLSAVVAYLLSGSLFLFFRLNATVAVAVSAIVPFLVGNLDLWGNASTEPAPSDAGREQAQPEADEEETDAQEDDEDAAEPVYEAPEERGWEHYTGANHPGEGEPFWN